jgi:Secretion system C-terminal sorting domain
MICGASTTVSCTGPLTPSYTQQSSNGTSGPGATVPKGGTMTYTLTNLSPNTFYSVADATSGQAYASGVWTSSSATSGSVVTVTTYPLSTSGTYNGAIKATSVTATDMCSTIATLSSFTVLPVTLTEFRGEHSDGANDLRWQTAGEGNTVRFEVERSADGTSFFVIGTVPARGGNTTYLFTDNQLSAPVYYYRLRIVDAGGKLSYSKIIVIRVNGSSITLGTVRPNPFIDEVIVSFSSGSTQPVKLVLMDAAGRTVATRQLRSAPGLNEIKLDGLAALPKGIYVLKISCDDIQLQEKLLKVK